MDIKRPPKRKRWPKRVALGALAILAAAALLGFVTQRSRDAAFRATHPPPGSLVEVDGHLIHYRLGGAGDCTFVLEAGLGDYSGNWGELETSLSEIGRVFVYDRAGLGWSEVSLRPRTAQQIAAELHEVLTKAGIPKPYILVGHSLGGVSQYRYAMEFPEGIAGLLLIDPGHKDQLKRMPPPAFVAFLFPQLARAAPFGLPQLLFQSSDPVQNLSRHVQASGAELRAVLNIGETWGDRPLQIGNIPIYVMTAGDFHGLPGKSDDEKRAAWQTWRSMHAELVEGSTSEIRKQVVVAGALHSIHRTHSAAVVDAARELIDRIRAQKN